MSASPDTSPGSPGVLDTPVKRFNSINSANDPLFPDPFEDGPDMPGMHSVNAKMNRRQFLQVAGSALLASCGTPGPTQASTELGARPPEPLVKDTVVGEFSQRFVENISVVNTLSSLTEDERLLSKYTAGTVEATLTAAQKLKGNPQYSDWDIVAVKDAVGATLVHYRTLDTKKTVDITMAMFKIAGNKSKGIEQYQVVMQDPKTAKMTASDGILESDVVENIGGIATHTQRFSILDTNTSNGAANVIWRSYMATDSRGVAYRVINITDPSGKGNEKSVFLFTPVSSDFESQKFLNISSMLGALSNGQWKSSLDVLASIVPTATSPAIKPTTAAATATEAPKPKDGVIEAPNVMAATDEIVQRALKRFGSDTEKGLAALKVRIEKDISVSVLGPYVYSADYGAFMVMITRGTPLDYSVVNTPNGSFGVMTVAYIDTLDKNPGIRIVPVTVSFINNQHQDSGVYITKYLDGPHLAIRMSSDEFKAALNKKIEAGSKGEKLFRLGVPIAVDTDENIKKTLVNRSGPITPQRALFFDVFFGDDVYPNTKLIDLTPVTPVSLWNYLKTKNIGKNGLMSPIVGGITYDQANGFQINDAVFASELVKK